MLHGDLSAIPPDGAVLLAVSNSHLRAGDLEAAYRWFVASQLEERRRHLGPEGPKRIPMPWSWCRSWPVALQWGARRFDSSVS